MSSKKKKRRMEWLKRQKKRQENKERMEIRNKVLNSDDIEEAAKIMGIRLR